MKKIDSYLVNVLEGYGFYKGTWVIMAQSYGHYRVAERVSFYEYQDTFFSVIDRFGNRGKTIVYMYKNKEEGNNHFNKIKEKTEEIGLLFRKDTMSFESNPCRK